MKYDEYDIFESPDLRLFCNKDKRNALADLVGSGMELITPSELLSAQLSFPDANDLTALREGYYETRVILLDKRTVVYADKCYDRSYHPSKLEPEIIIVSPKQIQTNDLVKVSKGYGGRDVSGFSFSLDKYNELKKEALPISGKIFEEFFSESEKGVQDMKWKEGFLEFILEGKQQLIKEYIQFSEEIIKKPFYENLLIRGTDSYNIYHDWHLLRINSAHICPNYFNSEGKAKIADPECIFDDTSDGRYFFGTCFIGTTERFRLNEIGDRPL